MSRRNTLPFASDLSVDVSSAYLDQTVAGALLDWPAGEYVEEEVLHALASQGALDQVAVQAETGPDGLSWRLGRSVMATSLTTHLIRCKFNA